MHTFEVQQIIEYGKCICLHFSSSRKVLSYHLIISKYHGQDWLFNSIISRVKIIIIFYHAEITEFARIAYGKQCGGNPNQRPG